MFADNVSPLFTIQLKNTSSKTDTINSLLPYLFDINSQNIIRPVQIQELLKIVRTFSILYVCKSKELGLHDLTESDLLQGLNHLGFYSKNNIINVGLSNMLTTSFR